MEALIQRIVAELTVCFVQAGRNVDERIDVLAASLEDALKFNSVEEVMEAFKRAKMIDVIPNQKSLYEALKNYREEVVKYKPKLDRSTALEYRDPRAAWLPKDDVGKKVNRAEAVKNYCIAAGRYDEYVQKCGSHKDVNGKSVWNRPEEARAFYVDVINECIVPLYKKYLRQTHAYLTYPANAPLNIGLIHPTVEEFRMMIEKEQYDKEH